ncbi:IQ motif and ubiquitin-like domain-containing protein [Rhinophrynus dorsalis]
MEHQSQSTYQSVDVAQQTDAESQTTMNAMIQEPITNEIDIMPSEPVLQDQDQQQILQAEENQNVNEVSGFEIEEQTNMVQSQPEQDQEIVHMETASLDMDKKTLVAIQSNSHDHKLSHLNLAKEHNINDQHPKEGEVSEQIGYQIDQESGPGIKESAEQEQEVEQRDPAENCHRIKEQEQVSTEERTATLKEGSVDGGKLEKILPPDVSNATATVKVMLVPDGQVVTMAFSIGYTVGNLKRFFACQLKTPETIIRIMFDGRVVEDQETLMDLGVTLHGTIQLEMLSLDPENYPIKAIKLQHEYSMPDVITVRVQTGEDSYQDLVVEIERLNYRKPYLGGYRHKVTGMVFHHAGTQTAPKKRPDKGIVVFCRDTQTVHEKNKLQQCRNTMSTQMTKIGCYVANISDKLIKPNKYVTADEFHAKRLKAAIVIQTYFRRFLAKRVVQQIREEKIIRLEWEEREELRKKKEKEDWLRRDYERRMNPKTKEDFELLYHALELWRKEEVESINQTYTGAERKAALCALLEQETQLIASIGRHKINANEENQQKAIQFLLDKCCEPKRWKAFDGKTTEMDTQYTIRARELRDIYTSINTTYFSPDERLDALLTLKLTVKEHDCKLTQEIVELIDREADLLMRGVKNCNLEGLRKRISTLFLQYIKLPTFNPEVARLLKVPQDSSVLRKDIYFCPSCKSYLPSTEFSLSANARSVARCRKCSKLDNEARRREEFSKYKMLLQHLKKSELDYGDESRIVFLLQQQDLQYLVENIWGSHSALSACDDLYDLVMVRWDKYYEWSPWNCVLLTKDEAAAHLKLANVEQAYGIVFIRKIKHRHTLAKNYFSQIPEMAPFLHGEKCNQMSSGNELIRLDNLQQIINAAVAASIEKVLAGSVPQLPTSPQTNPPPPMAEDSADSDASEFQTSPVSKRHWKGSGSKPNPEKGKNPAKKGKLTTALEVHGASRLSSDEEDPDFPLNLIEVDSWQANFSEDEGLYEECSGYANVAISNERRKAALLLIVPKLAELSAKELGPSANGMLFGEPFLKELQKHVNIFSSLSKAQVSLKKVFRPTPQRGVFGRADHTFHHREVPQELENIEPVDAPSSTQADFPLFYRIGLRFPRTPGFFRPHKATE